ncbi:hypothetical protein C8J57DRAFT_1223137 [Mycena rebaudengoi]|nr:hypothetical protein C8J57DRAFT_1223137 [Mycena rebaudengoi]
MTAEIFVQCLPDGNGQVPRPSKAPLLLVICRAWRDLALSTPALWTRLDMLFDKCGRHPGSTDPTNSAGFIRNWFSRAGDLPPSFCFWEYGASQFLRVGTSNWVSTPKHSLSYGTRQISPSSAAYVSCLWNGDCQPITTFSIAPQLRILSLAYVKPSAVMIPWVQLKSVDFCGIWVAECLTVFRNAPYLREFQHSHSNPGHHNTEVAPVVHTALVSLNLGNVGGIIPFLPLPMLEQLSLNGISDSGHTVTPLALISSTFLRSFTFGDYTSMVSLQWIYHMEDLTKLELLPCGRTNTHFFVP